MLKYEQLLKEEGKTVAELPNEIKAKIRTINMAVAKAAKNPANPNFQASVTKQDILIADSIQTFIEAGLPSKPVGEPEAQKAEKEAERVKAEAQKADEEKAAEAEKAKNVVMEYRNQIVAKMNAHSMRYIDRHSLCGILGREPNFRENVGDLNIVKVVMVPGMYRAEN